MLAQQGHATAGVGGSLWNGAPHGWTAAGRANAQEHFTQRRRGASALQVVEQCVGGPRSNGSAEYAPVFTCRMRSRSCRQSMSDRHSL